MTAAFRDRDTSDHGFTLIELMVVLVVGGILLAIGGTETFSWQRGAEQRGSAAQIQSALRKGSLLAVSEGRTYCVDVTRTTWATWRYACGATGTQIEGTKSTQSSRVTIAATVSYPSPAPACPAGDACVYFYPRGTATPATLTVSSSARSTVYTIRVEGLTARVYQ